MQLTKNFNLSEFITDNDKLTLQQISNLSTLTNELQALRDALNKPITITSGYRSKTKNKAVGGVKNSKHMQGKAADIQAKDTTPDQLYNNIEFLKKHYKLNLKTIVYPNHVHVSLP